MNSVLNEILKEQSKLGSLCDRLEGSSHANAKKLGPYFSKKYDAHDIFVF